jgi:hypothetical protein
MAGTRTVSLWPAVSTAVGALTLARSGSYGRLADVLGDPVPVEVAAVLTTITTALLKGVAPGDAGAALLQELGLLAASQEASEQAEGTR